MNKTLLLTLILLITAAPGISRTQTATETEADLIRRAAAVAPSPRQYAWQQLETIAFTHFGINTFTDHEWGDGTEDPALFNPTAFDARQWARVCKAAGLKMIILTAKHHDGFCLWPSAFTDHSVKRSPWRGGKGDVVREVAEACREYGLKFGVYLSPWDRHEPSYGDSPRYNAHFMNQLRELLTQYGEVAEVWFDGACGEGPNGKRQVYDFQAWYQLIRELQPNAVIAIMGPDVRWVGTEAGYGRETEWSVLPAAALDTDAIAARSQQQASDAAFVPGDLTDADLGSRDRIHAAPRLIWYPAEADVSIRPGWFYHASQDGQVKSAEKLLDIYYGSAGRNCVLLLNLPPDQRGLIHENDAAVLLGMRQALDATFSANLLAGARITAGGGGEAAAAGQGKFAGAVHAAEQAAAAGQAAAQQQVPPSSLTALTDGDPASFWRAPDGSAATFLTAELDGEKNFDVLALQEPIRNGQRIEAFELQVPSGSGWRSITFGTTVGYKRLLRFPPVTASRVRLVISRSRTEPALAEWGLYKQPAALELAPAGGRAGATMVPALPELPRGNKRPALQRLAKQGRSPYHIVLPEHPAAAEQRAAGLLQEYLRRSTGAELPIVSDAAADGKKEIRIGAGRRLPAALAALQNQLPEDGFYIGPDGDNIILLGGADRGAVYGAVHFLEKYLGCRKYTPTVEVVPPHRDLTLRITPEIQAPANRFRSIHSRFLRDPGYKEWMRLDDVNDIYGRGYYVHTFDRLVPRADYFASHPEYYCWMNGKRIHDQLCLSHPEVLRLTIAHLRQAMVEQPDRKYWSVSQNDNFSYCQCPDCQKIIEEEGSPAGPLLRFVNAVAKEFPDKVISTLAYQFSRPAPRITRPAENVQIVLCTIELNRSKPIEADPESQDFVRDIHEWSQRTRNLFIWDYVVQFTNFVSPFPNLHVLQPNLQFFVRNGGLEHFQQSNGQSGGEMAELKNWLIAKWLWNPDLDGDSLKKDFLQGYFAAAAPFIGAYLGQLETELMRSGQRLDIYGSPVWNAATFLSAENVAEYSRLFDQAEAAVADQPGLLQRVRTARMPLQYAVMEIGKDDLFGPRGWYREEGGAFVLRPEMRATLEKFHTAGQAAGLGLVNESGFTLEDYYQTTLRFIDARVEGNLAFRKPVTAAPMPSPKYANGDLAVLTNGVQGASDYKVHWLGWEGVDFTLTLDLGAAVQLQRVRLASLYDPKSWILHPRRVSCLVSSDGKTFQSTGSETVEGDQRQEPKIHEFVFTALPAGVRWLRFEVEGTRHLPAWHPSEGGLSWVFFDEIVVE
ncbi:MAG TPA: DUF4838 domain-containing protein [bacterium]|nr:DUF4838 domain-containing protein [bacterium]